VSERLYPHPPISGLPPERRTLIVGPGITVHGVVQDAERLVVEGTVDASMIHATELNVAQGGVSKDRSKWKGQRLPVPSRGS
jgi:hypothetical protein